MSVTQSEIDEPGIRLRYSLTPEQVLEVISPASAEALPMSRAQLLRKHWLMGPFCFAAAIGAATLTSAATGSGPLELRPLSLFFAAGFAVWATVRATSPTGYSKRLASLSRAANKSVAALSTGTIELELDEAEIRYRDRWGHARYPWTSIYKVDETAGCLSLKLANFRIITVPLDRLGAEQRAFVEAQAARGGIDRIASGFLRGAESPCPRCRYNLINHTSAICPECGKQLSLMELSVIRCEHPAREPQDQISV